MLKFFVKTLNNILMVKISPLKDFQVIVDKHLNIYEQNPSL